MLMWENVKSSLNPHHFLLMNLGLNLTDDVDAYASFCVKIGHVPMGTNKV